MVNVFQLNKRYGEWAEETIYNYFKSNKKRNGFDIFYFGSQVNTKKKDLTDAPPRPDFILLKNDKIKYLENKYKINFNKPNLKKLLKIIEISDENEKILKYNPKYWMTKTFDKEKLMKDIVKNVFCMIEVKSGFGLFDEKKYKQGKINIMLPLDFKKRILKIQRKFNANFETYAVYVLLDKCYIANMKKMYGVDGKISEYSYERRGQSDVKKNKFRTLTFNKSYFFADVEGIVYGRGSNKKLKAKPYIEVINGSVKFNLEMKPAKLKKVNIDVIKKLKN